MTTQTETAKTPSTAAIIEAAIKSLQINSQLTAYQVHNVINAINSITGTDEVKPQEIYGYAKRYLNVKSMSGVTFDIETLKNFLIAYYSGQIASSGRVGKNLSNSILANLAK